MSNTSSAGDKTPDDDLVFITDSISSFWLRGNQINRTEKWIRVYYKAIDLLSK